VTDEPHVLFEKRGAAGLITLNRPKALNALTHGMCLQMASQLGVWAKQDDVKTIVIQGSGERAFCAGGDIRSLYESGLNKTPYALNFYRDEYVLNALVKHYPKPYVALISGIVMGGGVGVSVHGSHRIADETTVFAMPETGIGLFPDVGGSFFLPRCPGEIGMYLALTGARLKTADCLYAGVATHFVPREKRGELLARLERGDAPDDALEGLHEDVPDTFLKDHRKSIDTIFAKGTVEEVLAALDADHTDWSRDTAKTIRAKSPTSTKVAFRQLREGAKLGFDDCMKMEWRMVNRIVAGHDFYEGVRATIIDKDGAPKWKPASLAGVSDADVDAYFAPVAGELALQAGDGPNGSGRDRQGGDGR
jgi:enoyl-CoA hydratase